MYRDIRHKIKQQRTHLVSMRRFLIEQIELKNEIIGFVQSSEAQLNQALQLENSSSAHKIYSLFWALRLKLLNISDVKRKEDEKKPMSYEDIVSKMVDCCRE